LTTIEENRYTIELTAQGFRWLLKTLKTIEQAFVFKSFFRIVGACHDLVQDSSGDENSASFFETPYSLLESISPAYTGAFGEALVKKLGELQQQ
jgi:hypothetical protein